MGHQLKKFDFGDGRVEQESACMSYVCKYCGVKASACNYVLGLCLQVYAPHLPGCGAYVESEKMADYVTECSTCAYNSPEGCAAPDERE